MGVGLAIIAGQYCGQYISCDKVFPDSRGPGNPTGSAQCAGSGNGSSRHTVVPLSGTESNLYPCQYFLQLLVDVHLCRSPGNQKILWQQSLMIVLIWLLHRSAFYLLWISNITKILRFNPSLLLYIDEFEGGGSLYMLWILGEVGGETWKSVRLVFSVCPFTGKCPLTTSSTGILIASPSTLLSIHSFKTQDTTSCLDHWWKKSLRHSPRSTGLV